MWYYFNLYFLLFLSNTIVMLLSNDFIIHKYLVEYIFGNMDYLHFIEYRNKDSKRLPSLIEHNLHFKLYLNEPNTMWCWLKLVMVIKDFVMWIFFKVLVVFKYLIMNNFTFHLLHCFQMENMLMCLVMWHIKKAPITVLVFKRFIIL